ncbi:HNH endonuclease [Phenylobacterium sp.]|uniref:HNH endonuclease n=1 Tax=Phenylobacterium sp. TaxID=1871053 RepID=UPI002DE54E5B|nr:HNH endonuclease [Phenylobacterium sp.]
MAYFLETGVALIGRSVDLRHACDNRACCNPAHLEPGTRRQNIEDMVSRGRSTKGRPGNAQPTGEDSWAAKLTVSDVTRIRQALEDGQTGKGVAAAFRVSPATISMIKNNRRWSASL